MDAPTLIEVPETSSDEWPLWAVRAHAERTSKEAIDLLRQAISSSPQERMIVDSLRDTLDELLCEGWSTPIQRFETAAGGVAEIHESCAKDEYTGEYLALLKRCYTSLNDAAKALSDLRKHEVLTYWSIVPCGSGGLISAIRPSWN